MLRLSRSRVFEHRIACVSGAAPAGRTFTKRSKIALTAGFIVAAATAILVGPNLGTVFAESDDHASFWRAERARNIAAQQRAVPPQPKSQQHRDARRQQQPSRQATAYAPVSGYRAQPDPSNPFWFLERRYQPAKALAPDQQADTRMRGQDARRANASFSGPARSAPNRFVCVRLCDGYFFPAPLGFGASDAGCATACPSAPTRLYSMRTDKITDAVSVRGGTPYAKLPVALHYTRNREQTCSCGAVDPHAAVLADASLRRGDRFMTENGFQIYQGGRSRQISRKDFKSVTQAPGLPRQERNLLLAMERVSLPRYYERLATTAPVGAQARLGSPQAAQRIAAR
jgi:hypothetical protein